MAPEALGGGVDVAAEFAALVAAGLAEVTRELGGMAVRLVRIAAGGESRWDVHDDGPETVGVWSGVFDVAFDERTLSLGSGQLCVVSAGARHRGTSPEGAEVMLLRHLG